MSPAVSIVMPLFNHERFVAEAIESVLGQTLTAFELIVVDDGSTDGSAKEVSRFTDPRIRYLYQENSGAHSALNRGIDLAQGDFVAVLNSDDVYHPERLEIAHGSLTEGDADAFFSAYDFIDDQSRVTRAADEILAGTPIPGSPGTMDTSLIPEQEWWVLRLLAGNLFHTTSNLVMRRRLVPAIGAFRPWRYVHDLDFFLRLCLGAKILFDPRALLGYRFHSSNTLDEAPITSVLETTLVLFEFLSHWRLGSCAHDEAAGELLPWLAKRLRVYGGERLLLALLLTERICPDQALDLSGLIRGTPLREEIRASLTAGITQDRLTADLAWQKEVASRWWQTSQQLEADLREAKHNLGWQEEQTARWWQEAQTRTAALDARTAELNWANSVLENTTADLHKTVAALVAHRRFFGLGGVGLTCHSRLRNLLARWRS